MYTWSKTKLGKNETVHISKLIPFDEWNKHMKLKYKKYEKHTHFNITATIKQDSDNVSVDWYLDCDLPGIFHLLPYMVQAKLIKDMLVKHLKHMLES